MQDRLKFTKLWKIGVAKISLFKVIVLKKLKIFQSHKSFSQITSVRKIAVKSKQQENCITEMFFKKVLERSEAVDDSSSTDKLF